MSTPPDPFDHMEPGDGFRVRKVTNPTRLALYLEVQAGGELHNLRGSDPDDATILIAAWDDPTPADWGAMERLYLACDALCRYFTTGGNWAELDDVLGRARSFLAGLVYPGYYLLDTYLNDDCAGEHIFVKDGTDEVRLWVEDAGAVGVGFIDALRLGDLDASTRPSRLDDQGGRAALQPPRDPPDA